MEAHGGVPDPRYAAAIAAAIKSANRSQASIARETGMSEATLSRRLNGLDPFKLPEVHRIAAVLGTTASQLLADAERGAA